MAPAFKSISVTHAWQNLNTPQTLWASLYIIWALDVLLLIAAIVGAQVHRGAMQAVGKNTAPSMIHAQHIKSALADMDANAANELLGAPGQMLDAAKTYERRRKEAATALIEAARNIKSSDDEQQPIEAIQVGLGTYEAKVQRARDLHAISDASYVDAYRDAARVMDNDLLPKAGELDKVNKDVLDNVYREHSGESITAIFFILLLGAALLAALVAIQRFLNQRTRRILNPMLVLTTLLTLGFVLYSYNALRAERHQLKVAKEDAFDSIHALWRARAVAYAANADESRYLLDLAHAQEYERNFHEKAAKIVTLPAYTPIVRVVEAYRDGQKLAGFAGYLADELNNVTFAGEQQAALNELEYFGDYLNIDEQIRILQKSGKHAEALQLCIGMSPGESNWAFDRFDQAIEKTLGINQTAFQAAVDEGFSALAHFEIKASIVAVIIALLAFLGLDKRIQEYR